MLHQFPKATNGRTKGCLNCPGDLPPGTSMVDVKEALALKDIDIDFDNLCLRFCAFIKDNPVVVVVIILILLLRR